MNIIVPLINGKSYEWSDITLNIMGVPIVGITNIEYSETQDMMNIYGAGRRPVSRGYGKIETEAKITLLMEEIENIMSVAPNRLIMDIPEFDITVAFTDDALQPRVHILKNVRFKNNGRTSATGDQSISVELELILSHVDWRS
jgi:hypothetical protein